MNPYAVLDPAVALLHRLLAAVASALPFDDPGARLVLALVLVTLATRAATLPLALRAHRAAQARAALAPQLAALRRRHGRDRQRLAAETARLHRESGTPLTAGLLPALVRLPVLATTYRLLVVPTVAGTPNLVLVTHLFGAPMAAHWPELLAVGGVLSPGAVACVLVFVGLAVLALVQSRDAAQLAQTAGAAQAAGRSTGRSSGAAAGTTVPDLTGVLRLLPYGTVLIAAVTPVAMGVYLLTGSAWAVFERRLLVRLAGA